MLILWEQFENRFAETAGKEHSKVYGDFGKDWT